MTTQTFPHNHRGVHQSFEYVMISRGHYIKQHILLEEVTPLPDDLVSILGRTIEGKLNIHIAKRTEIDRGYCDKMAHWYLTSTRDP